MARRLNGDLQLAGDVIQPVPTVAIGARLQGRAQDPHRRICDGLLEVVQDPPGEHPLPRGWAGAAAGGGCCYGFPARDRDNILCRDLECPAAGADLHGPVVEAALKHAPVFQGGGLVLVRLNILEWDLDGGAAST